LNETTEDLIMLSAMTVALIVFFIMVVQIMKIVVGFMVQISMI